jgi:hypothetical protein
MPSTDSMFRVQTKFVLDICGRSAVAPFLGMRLHELLHWWKVLESKPSCSENVRMRFDYSLAPCTSRRQENFVKTGNINCD